MTSFWKAFALGVCAALLCSAPAGPALAQPAPAATAETPAAATPPVKPPAVVATADIGVEVEKAKSRLARMQEALSPDQATTQIQAKLPDLAKRVETLLAEFEALDGSDPNLSAIDGNTILNDSLRAELTAMQAGLRRQMNDLDEKLTDLRKERARWAATRTSLEEADAPKPVLDLVGEADRAVAQAEALARTRQGTLAELQGRVASLNEALAQQTLRLDELKNSASRKVLQADLEPLWDLHVWRKLLSGELMSRIREEQQREIGLARAYLLAHRPLLALHGLALVVLTLAMIAVRRRADRSAIADDGFTRVQAIFDRPFALALLLVILASYWGLPEFPRGLRNLLGIFLVVPAVVILRRILEPSAHSVLNALIGFFVADRLQQVIALAPDAGRLLFTLEMIALLALLLWWMRPSRLVPLRVEAEAAGNLRVIAIGLRISLIGSSLAILLSIVGHSTLATLVGTTLLYAASTALVLYGAARTLEGLLAFLLQVQPLRLLRGVRRNRALLYARGAQLINLGLTLWWLQVQLERLGIFDPIWRAGGAILTAELSMGEVTLELGDLVIFAITVWASFAISRFLRFVMEEDVYPRLDLAKGMPYAVSALSHYCILLVGFVLAISALGINTDRFALLAGAFGVGIGFGLQNVVNNFVSGLILLTERPVEVGDTVTIGQTFGLVQRIGIRSSTLRTWQGAEVIVPNAQLVSEEVTNWTHSDTRRRMEVPIGVAYGTSPQRVIDIVAEAAKTGTNILADPEPVVLFMNYGDSALEFEVRAWTSNFDNFQRVRSDLMVVISAALAEHGIEIPFPQRDLHIKSLPSPVSEPAQREEEK